LLQGLLECKHRRSDNSDMGGKSDYHVHSDNIWSRDLNLRERNIGRGL
jgi:hypothetical protein